MKHREFLWSSRLTPCGASPSPDPGVRLFRTGLLARLIHLHLSVDTDVDFWTSKRVFLQHVVESIPTIALFLASSVQPEKQTSAHSITETAQALGIVSDSVVMEVTNKNLIHLVNNLRNRQYPHFLNALMNLSAFLGEFLPTGFPLHSELTALAFRAFV